MTMSAITIVDVREHYGEVSPACGSGKVLLLTVLCTAFIEPASPQTLMAQWDCGISSDITVTWQVSEYESLL